MQPNRFTWVLILAPALLVLGAAAFAEKAPSPVFSAQVSPDRPAEVRLEGPAGHAVEDATGGKLHRRVEEGDHFRDEDVEYRRKRHGHGERIDWRSHAQGAMPPGFGFPEPPPLPPLPALPPMPHHPYPHPFMIQIPVYPDLYPHTPIPLPKPRKAPRPRATGESSGEGEIETHRDPSGATDEVRWRSHGDSKTRIREFHPPVPVPFPSVGEADQVSSSTSEGKVRYHRRPDGTAHGMTWSSSTSSSSSTTWPPRAK